MSMPKSKNAKLKGLSTLKAIENYSVGTGQKQIDMAYHSQHLIFDTLFDGQWHQRKEIKDKTRLSSHALDKHLNAMVENNVIFRRKDTESGKYPVPTEYRASQELIEFLQHEENIDKWIRQIEEKTGMPFGKEAYEKYTEHLKESGQ